MTGKSLKVTGEQAMLEAGARIARGIDRSEGMLIFLKGDLGAGKTTLVRGLMRGLGYTGTVKSPTYTIVEPYQLSGIDVYHFDLYRLSDPEELEYIGARDYLDSGALCLVEWPEQGEGMLPEPDLFIEIEHLRDCRNLYFSTSSEAGHRLLAAL